MDRKTHLAGRRISVHSALDENGTVRIKHQHLQCEQTPNSGFRAAKYRRPMKTFPTLMIASVLVLSVWLQGCSSSEQAMADADTAEIPSWFVNPPEDPNYFFTASTAASRDLQTAINQATTDARAELGRNVEVQVEAMQKNFTEEVGVDEDATFRQMFEEVSRTVVATSLSGSQVKEQHHERDGNMWRAYVLMEYPIGAANKQLMEQLQEEEEMYTRFRQSQAFEELEQAVQDYEERQ